MVEFTPVDHDPFVADAGTTLEHAAGGMSGIPDRGPPTFTASDSLNRLYDVWKRGSEKYTGMVDNPLDISNLADNFQKIPGFDMFGGIGTGDIGMASATRNVISRNTKDATEKAIRAIKEALRIPAAETSTQRVGATAASSAEAAERYRQAYLDGRITFPELEAFIEALGEHIDTAPVTPVRRTAPGNMAARREPMSSDETSRVIQEIQDHLHTFERQTAGTVSSSRDPANIAETLRRRTDESKLIRDWLGVDPNRFRGEVTTNPPSISGHILDENGQSIATIDRNLRGDKAHHGYFHLNTSRQGADFGKNLLRSNIDFYRNRGTKVVDLLANLDVGGYAWAKYGFVPTQESWNDLRRRLLRSLDAPAANAASLPGYAQAKRILQDSDPKSIWALSDMKLPTHFVGRDGKPLSFGKWLLLGTRWDGELNLNHAGAMERFDSYVSPKK